MGCNKRCKSRCGFCFPYGQLLRVYAPGLSGIPLVVGSPPIIPFFGAGAPLVASAKPNLESPPPNIEKLAVAAAAPVTHQIPISTLGQVNGAESVRVMRNLHPVVISDGFKSKLAFTSENVKHVSDQHKMKIDFTNHRGIADVEEKDLLPIIVSGVDDLADGISKIHRRLIALETEQDAPPQFQVSFSHVSGASIVPSAPPLYPQVPKISS